MKYIDEKIRQLANQNYKIEDGTYLTDEVQETLEKRKAFRNGFEKALELNPNTFTAEEVREIVIRFRGFFADNVPMEQVEEFLNTKLV